MPKTHPNYDSGFRQEAVNLLMSSQRPLKRVAAELESPCWSRPPRSAACSARTNIYAASARS